YLINKEKTLSINGEIQLIGAGKKRTTFKESGARSGAMFDIKSNEVKFSAIGFYGADTFYVTRPLVSISAGENIGFENCYFYGGKAGVWANPIEENIKGIHIKGC